MKLSSDKEWKKRNGIHDEENAIMISTQKQESQ